MLTETVYNLLSFHTVSLSFSLLSSYVFVQQVAGLHSKTTD